MCCDDRLKPQGIADETPKGLVFFPWKAMLIISLILTVSFNFIEVLAR